MPEKMTENLLSLISVEVLISHVRINPDVECHLPCIVFRLLDYPAVSISYFDQWQIEEFNNLKRDYPNFTWRQLLSDQFYELRSANGNFNFKRGKSCLFKTYFKTLYTHLLNVPMFLLLIDQINDNGTNDSTTQFIGSCNVKLNELIEILNQSIIKNGSDIPLVEQQTFHCSLFNLMGTHIGTCDVAIRLCHYGTTILTQLSSLDDEIKIKTDEKILTTTEDRVNGRSASSVLQRPQAQSIPPTDTIVKHVHFVNEKKDVGLQLSRSDLPSSSNDSKSVQTRWTSTKTRPIGYHHLKDRYAPTTADLELDESLSTSYQPPPLYFNSNSDFLHMMTPDNAKYIEQAKEYRLSYLASIPIASFADEFDDEKVDDNNNRYNQTKSKSAQSVRFNLPLSSSPPPRSPTIPSTTKVISKQRSLTQDFLHNFPLLRALVEEALALQGYQRDMPTSFKSVISSERSQSVGQREQQKSPTKPKSAIGVRSTGTKSVIVTRNINNTRRLYPPPPETRRMVVTKTDLRNLVDRLSKPKFNRKLEQQIVLAEQMSTDEEIARTLHLPPKSTSVLPISARKSPFVKKPPLSYGTTRAHRLYTEFSRARRAAYDLQTAAPTTKSPVSPRKESPSNGQVLPLSPQLLNTGTLSNLSLLNKVDIDTVTIEKNSIQQSSSEQNIAPATKSSSTTSQDVSKGLKQSSSSSSSSSLSLTYEPIIPENNYPNIEKTDLGYSITDVTDFFTEGQDESNSRPSTQQSA